MNKWLEFLFDEDLIAKPPTLFIGIIVILLGLLAVDNSISHLLPAYLRFPAYILLDIIWIIFWLRLYYKLPKSDENKIGIVLLITTESDKTRKRLESDLLRKLQNFIDVNKLDDIVHIVLAKNYQAKRVLPIFDELRKSYYPEKKANLESLPDKGKRFLEIQKKVKGSFYIFGSIEERSDEGENTYVLELNSTAVHPIIESEYKKQILEAFGKAWFPKVLIKEKEEIKGFELVSKQYYYAIRYLLGVALLFSGKSEAAYRIHNSLEKSRDFILHQQILSDLRKYLAIENDLMARHYYFNEGDVNRAKQFLVESLNHDTTLIDSYLLRAIIEFSNEKNPRKALRTIDEAQRHSGKDGSWRYSAAFLHFYLEEFDNGMNHYYKIAGYEYDEEQETLEQVIEFIRDFLEKNQKQLQCYFILGFLYLKKVKNHPEALIHFETFCNKAKYSKYKKLKSRAERYIKTIKEQMELSD